MRIRTYLPGTRLQPFVSAYTIVDTWQESRCKVLPDTGLVLGFQFKGRLSHLENGKKVLLDSTRVSGLSDQYNVFKNAADRHTVGVL